MPNPKCPICKCYIPEPSKKSSGEIFKTCERCRGLQKKQRDKDKVKNTDIEIKKDPELKEDGIVKIKDIEYEVKGKILDRDRARELIPNFDKLEDMPDENVVIPDECFKYVLGAKKVVTPEMMEKLGIRITSADDEDNNIYPVDDVVIPCGLCPENVNKRHIYIPESSSSEEND